MTQSSARISENPACAGGLLTSGSPGQSLRQIVPSPAIGDRRRAIEEEPPARRSPTVELLEATRIESTLDDLVDGRVGLLIGIVEPHPYRGRLPPEREVEFR